MWQRNLLWHLLLVISLMLMAGLWVISDWIHHYIDEREIERIEREVDMLGAQARADFLLRNYDVIEDNLTEWAANHGEIVVLSLTTENGFRLVNYQRELDGDQHDLHGYQKEIQLGGQLLFTVAMVVDDQKLHDEIYDMQLKAIATTLLMMLLIAMVVWFTIKQIALDPLSQKLRQQVVELKEAQRIKDDFLAAMSHEMRTPLTSILGFCDLLCERVEDPKEREYLHAIEIAGKGQLALVNDILDHWCPNVTGQKLI